MIPSLVRADLAALDRLTYLNTGTAGILPRAAVDAMRASIEEDFTFGRLSPRRYRKMEDERVLLRGLLARVAGADPDHVVLTTGTVAGVNLIIGARGPRPNTRTLTTTLEHPDALLPLLQRERDGGSRVERVVIPDDADDAQIVASFAARIRRGGPVDTILVSHVSYATGRILPVEAIVDTARALDILTIIDGVQAIGALPVDAPRIGADAYVFSAHKWLQGPESVGALILGDRGLEKLDRIPGLGSAAVVREDHLERAVGARAIEGVIPGKESVRGAIAALEWREGLGHGDMLTAETRRVAGELRSMLRGHPTVRVVTPDSCAGLLSFRFEGLPAGRVSWELGQARVAVRDIPGADLVRVSAGYFLDENDLERFDAALRMVGHSPEPESCPIPAATGGA